MCIIDPFLWPVTKSYATGYKDILGGEYKNVSDKVFACFMLVVKKDNPVVTCL
jgi:hypothetical protein